jgi:predicted lipoprotein with Yx(FWY)xxD motif
MPGQSVPLQFDRSLLMNLKSKPYLLVAAIFLGAAPAFADSVVVAPGGEATIVPEGGVAIAPGSTVVVKPGSAVVVTQSAPVNVGLEGIVAWGNTNIGPGWVDIKGMALYNYDQDTVGKSACNGNCAAAWPPLAAEAGTKGIDEWTVVDRDDGTKQWAFRGHPLYTFVKDTVPGEVNGDGAGGFHLAD